MPSSNDETLIPEESKPKAKDKTKSKKKDKKKSAPPSRPSWDDEPAADLLLAEPNL